MMREKLTEEEEAGYEAARAEFFLVCRGDPETEKCWPKAAAALGAGIRPFQAKVESLKAELAQAQEWIRLIGRSEAHEMTTERA